MNQPGEGAVPEAPAPEVRPMPSRAGGQDGELMGHRVKVSPLENGVVHVAVSPREGENDVAFYDKQAIKSVIGGRDATAVEVYPPDAELVDDGPGSADHLFILPPGVELPFTLPKLEEDPLLQDPLEPEDPGMV